MYYSGFGSAQFAALINMSCSHHLTPFVDAVLRMEEGPSRDSSRVQKVSPPQSRDPRPECEFHAFPKLNVILCRENVQWHIKKIRPGCNNLHLIEDLTVNALNVKKEWKGLWDGKKRERKHGCLYVATAAGRTWCYPQQCTDKMKIYEGKDREDTLTSTSEKSLA